MEMLLTVWSNVHRVIGLNHPYQNEMSKQVQVAGASDFDYWYLNANLSQKWQALNCSHQLRFADMDELIVS